jgi:hypothetical protein
MQIHPGEAEVGNGQITQPRQRLVWLERAAGDRFEELSYFFPLFTRICTTACVDAGLR